MAYAVVANQSNFMMFRREPTVELAQKTAEAQRLAGASAIRVFDQNWRLLDSNVIGSLVFDNAHRGTTSSGGADIRTIRIGGASSRSSGSANADKSPGRVRVFKGKKL